MPELPEVEVTRLSLSHHVEGAQVLGVRLGKPLRWPLGRDPGDLRGLFVGQLQRRGKYLWFPLVVGCDRADEGDVIHRPNVGAAPGGGLLFHLGMSGSLQFVPGGHAQATALGPHDHVELSLSTGHLRLHDPRRFGAVVWGGGLDHGLVGRLLARLGVEPLTPAWTAQHLYQGLRGRRVAIKQALLAGDIVVGVGNIYASEALFRAGIHPETVAERVGPMRCERLVRSVREVLTEAVAAGGSSLRDFRDAQGQSGHFQLATQVYGREGEPCRRCATPITRLVQGQRSTFYCKRCQRR